METTQTTVEKKKLLEPKGLVLLIVSWVLALVLIVVGIVVNAGGFDSEGSSGSSNSTSISVGAPYSAYAMDGKIYAFSVYLERGYTYDINLDNATLKGIKTNGTTIRYTRKGYSAFYDNIYTVEITQSGTYDVRIEATSNATIKILVN